MKLEEYVEQITREKCTCGHPIPKSVHAISMYPHEGGWPVEGMDKKQWLYIHCQKCGYEWALWKLGVPR